MYSASSAADGHLLRKADPLLSYSENCILVGGWDTCIPFSWNCSRKYKYYECIFIWSPASPQKPKTAKNLNKLLNIVFHIMEWEVSFDPFAFSEWGPWSPAQSPPLTPELHHLWSLIHALLCVWCDRLASSAFSQSECYWVHGHLSPEAMSCHKINATFSHKYLQFFQVKRLWFFLCVFFLLFNFHIHHIWWIWICGCVLFLQF